MSSTYNCMVNILLILEFGSPVLGFLGTLLLFFYGIPKQIDTGGAISIVCDGVDQEEQKKIERYKFLGNLGLWLIAVGFLMNLGFLILSK